MHETQHNTIEVNNAQIEPRLYSIVKIYTQAYAYTYKYAFSIYILHIYTYMLNNIRTFSYNHRRRELLYQKIF